MKNKIGLIFILIIISLASVSAAVPKIEPYVNDFAHLLSSDEINQLNLKCDAIEKNTSYEIAIVTVQDTGGQDKILYANEIGDQNGVGKKGKDNGVVVLWSVADGGAIATGRYSESILNDAKVSRIGREARPYFDKRQYAQGFNYIVDNINAEIIKSQDGSVNATNSTGTGSGSGNLDGKHIVLIILIVIVFLWVISKAGLGDIFAGIAIGSILGGRKSGGGGSSRGGGGGSFGGGSFGGGGGGF